MTSKRSLLIAVTSTLVAILAPSVLTTPAAASTAAVATKPPVEHTSTLRGVTEVTTAPGIATTLLRAGVLPLPVPRTSFRFGYNRGLTVTFGFPITGGDPDLAGPSGDITHAGGINFVASRGRHLEIGKFDIALADGKIYATQVNFAAARIPVLDLDLANLKVTTKHGDTVLSGIKLRLDPAAAGALNATFSLNLPTDGSLVFGSARITLRG